MPRLGTSLYVARTTNTGSGGRTFLVRSRRRAHLREKRHEHLVLWNPQEKLMLCNCPGFTYRRSCSAVRLLLHDRLRW